MRGFATRFYTDEGIWDLVGNTSRCSSSRTRQRKGESRFCKCHWSPLAGTHSLVWNEAVKLAGADPDFHRRDLWEAFEAGYFRVQTPAVRERIVAGLVNIDPGLAAAVAGQLGIEVPPPLPPSTNLPIPDYPPSPPLSLLARPGKTGIRTRRIALLVASGIDGDIVRELYAALLKEGAQPRLVGQRLGKAESFNGHPLDVEITLETSPSVMYDALVLPPGEAAMLALSRDGRAIEFVREQYRHLKPILALGSGATLLQAAGIPPRLPDGGEDWGLVVAEEADAAVAFAAFKAAVVRHRVYERETDPPRV